MHLLRFVLTCEDYEELVHTETMVRDMIFKLAFTMRKIEADEVQPSHTCGRAVARQAARRPPRRPSRSPGTNTCRSTRSTTESTERLPWR